jgi:hypothetical protein
MHESEKLKAYAYGYYDGRVVGLADNPYTDAVLRMAYDDGYDLGVSDYVNYDECDNEDIIED